MKQQQFLAVVSEREARARFALATAHLAPAAEVVSLGAAWGRRLAADIAAPIDVPAFDRSDVDGFAVRAEDTAGADEMRPLRLRAAGPPRAARRLDERAVALEVGPGECLAVATGAVLPRGADAVVMVEHTEPGPSGGGPDRADPAGGLGAARGLDGASAGWVWVRRAVVPSEHVTFAGTDVGRGEVVMRRGQRLGARDTGLLAALGVAEVHVLRRPRVLVLSTGDEVRPPGLPLCLGEVFDANQRMIADAAREAGAEVIEGGVLPDDEAFLRGRLARALDGPPARLGLGGGDASGFAGGSTARAAARSAGAPPSPLSPSREADLIVLSGGTSKGAGDLNYRVIERLARERPGSPGVLVHGVALKPGKPLCLAVIDGVPVVILPGFPISALFTFQEIVVPLVRRLAGEDDGPAPAPAPASARASAPEVASGASPFVEATLPLRLDGAQGRTSYTLVSLLDGPAGPVAFPLGAGSGSVGAFARADGYVRVGADEDYLPAGARVRVRPLGAAVRPRDLVAIGSHCTGLDALLSRLAASGFAVASVPVGSEGGLAALARGEGDVAGVHLLCPATGVYNLPFLPPGVRPLGGYGRRQGIVCRPGDPRLAARDQDGLLAAIAADRSLRLVNRNRGSGTRVLIDRLLSRAAALAGEDPAAPFRPPGYRVEAKSHHAVAAAVAQGRADWGVTLDGLAGAHGLAFTFVTSERYDLVARDDRRDRPAVRALAALLASDEGRALLAALGFEPG